MGDAGAPAVTIRDADADVNRWFGVNVRAELKSRGWSSRELSRRSGASASTLGLTVDELVKGSCTRCADRPPAGFTCGACGLPAPEPKP